MEIKMEQIVTNILRHDGMRYLKVIGDGEISFEKYLRAYVTAGLPREKVQHSIVHDDQLGIFTLEATWPMLGPYGVINNGPRKFRKFMAVNYAYAAKVSDCIALAVEAFMISTRHFPKLAYVRQLPKGAEYGMEIHGVILIESEIAPENCVLVGGLA
jgi:hypothetical protein